MGQQLLWDPLSQTSGGVSANSCQDSGGVTRTTCRPELACSVLVGGKRTYDVIHGVGSDSGA